MKANSRIMPFLYRSQFEGKADFIKISFQNADFSHLTVDKVMSFQSFQYPPGEKNPAHIINFSNNFISGKIRFINCPMDRLSFLFSDLNCFDFINTVWAEKKKRVLLYDEVIIQEGWESKRTEEIEDILNNIGCKDLTKNEISSEIIRLYIQLKNKYFNLKNFPLADRFFFSELELRRRQEKWYQPSWIKLYKISSYYGMSWMWPFLWIIIVFLLSTGFTFLGIYDSSSVSAIDTLEKSFRYNIYDTFFIKLKQEDVEKLGYLMVLLKIKTALISIFLIQLFLAVKRKFRT